jgi:hypothetical protein
VALLTAPFILLVQFACTVTSTKLFRLLPPLLLPLPSPLLLRLLLALVLKADAASDVLLLLSAAASDVLLLLSAAAAAAAVAAAGGLPEIHVLRFAAVLMDDRLLREPQLAVLGCGALLACFSRGAPLTELSRSV